MCLKRHICSLMCDCKHSLLLSCNLRLAASLVVSLAKGYPRRRKVGKSEVGPEVVGIQQLRGQEQGEGGSAKSPHLSTQGGGGVPWMSTWTQIWKNPPILKSISYHCAIDLHITLNWNQLNFKSYFHWKLLKCEQIYPYFMLTKNSYILT